MVKSFALLRKPGKQNGIMYFAIFLLSIVSMALGAFLGERVALFSEHPTSLMNTAEFYATFALACSSVLALLLLIHRNFRIRFSWPWFLLFFLLAIGNVSATLCFGTRFIGTIVYRGETYPYDLTFTFEQRIQYVLCFGLACVYFYLFFAVLPKVLPHTRWVRISCWLAVILAASAIVYSFIAEWNIYQFLFDPTKTIPSYWAVSFTNNENTYGYLVLMGIVGLLILHNAKPRFRYWILILALAVFEVLTLSATAIVCATFLILSYGIYRFCVNVRIKPVRSVLLLLLMIGAAITLAILLFTDPFGPGSTLAKLHAEITSYFGVRSKTFSTRVATWNIILQTLDSPFAWEFGIGDFQSRLYLGALHVPTVDGPSLYPAHNSFMQCLIDGGLIRLGVYLVVLGRFIYLAIKRLGSHSRTAMALLLCFIALMFHGFMESTVFLSMDTKGFTSMIMLFLPLEIEAFKAAHPEVDEYLLACKTDVRKIRYGYEYSPLRYAKIAFFFLTPAFLLGTGVGAIASRLGYFGIPADWSYYALFAMAWLLGPLAFLGLGASRSRGTGAGFFAALIIVIVGAGVGLMWLNVWATRIAFFALLLLCPLPFIINAKTASISLSKALKTAYLPHILIGGFLFGGTMFALLIPTEMASIQILVSLSLGLLFLYFFLISLPASLKLSFPFADKLAHVDARIVAKSVIREERLGKRKVRRPNTNFVPSFVEKTIYIQRW